LVQSALNGSLLGLTGTSRRAPFTLDHLSRIERPPRVVVSGVTSSECLDNLSSSHRPLAVLDLVARNAAAGPSVIRNLRIPPLLPYLSLGPCCQSLQESNTDALLRISLPGYSGDSAALHVTTLFSHAPGSSGPHPVVSHLFHLRRQHGRWILVGRETTCVS
jgi:hypothetical protein